MSDQGLSIFDHEPDNSADEPTQVIDRDGVGAGTQKTAQKTAQAVAEKPADKPAEKPAAQAPPAPAQRTQPAPAPARPAAAAPATPAAAQLPSLPTVRRGGYD